MLLVKTTTPNDATTLTPQISVRYAMPPDAEASG
jgi:hypothetical protein